MTYWFYYLTKWILWGAFHLAYGLEVRGQEHVPAVGPFVLAANHLSYLDPPVLGAACPRRLVFMARADLFRHPRLAAFMRGVHVLPVQRGEGDVVAIREAVRRLKAGDALAIFPEGGRQASGRRRRAKRGVGLIALAARVPVIPVLIQGTFDALPPEAKRLSRAKIRVAFGPAISYTREPLPPQSRGSEPHVEEPSAHACARVRHEQLADAVTLAWHRLETQLTQ